ncbi:hypothetical protein WAI453_008653 [Rhynchosporium graminicola]
MDGSKQIGMKWGIMSRWERGGRPWILGAWTEEKKRETVMCCLLRGGGMRTTQNRTNWPLKGGAIAIQPGWFQGHATAFFYINLGFGTDGPDHGPHNMSFPMVPVFQIVGPTRNPYPGTFCLPQVPLPANATVKVGDNATIQVVETAIHGASLFSCVDITFTEPDQVADINETNCFNSSDITFNNVYSIGAGGTSSSAAKGVAQASFLPLAGLLMFALL